jgi:valyl-tRNA synthetase
MDKYEPKIIEDRWYSFWMQKGFFKGDNESLKKPFSIVIPPPNVTGSLHMGHALNNTLQDILARYKRLTGYNVMWLPGCDHAGIATQNVVERELKKEGKKKTDLGREEFLKRVWEWKDQYGKTIMKQLRKLGSSLDWSRERFTMDEGLSNAVKEVFVSLYKDGLIYRGDYIVNWCPRCLTAISDIEVIHKEINGHLYHIKYPYADGSGSIEVATTRPETMLGDTAVAVNPDDPRYKDIKEGTMVILPETGRQIPIIKDSYVDKEFGTGAVKITPAHDPNDFEIGARHKLPVINVMHENAKMNEKAGVGGKYKDLDRFVARNKLVETLKEQGLLVKIEDHKHAVGHCYRCDTIVEPYISTQWYVKIKPLAEPAIEIVKNDGVKFVPEMWKKVYFEWMNNIKDWCISRQLWWGHRIPAWYCGDCKHITVEKETPGKCEKCGSTNIKQDEDVLDTWFSSGLWPFSTLGWPERTKDLAVFYPTSVLVTSWDILFFWVARMIMMGMKFMGKPPFANVVINSLVCDSEGRKMSKTWGNVVDPLDVMGNYSTDALRFTLTALETQTRYISFSEERLKGNHNFMNKIWNASKFVITNINGCEEIDLGVKTKELKMPEKWILSEMNKLIRRVSEDMEKYRFSDAAISVYEFFWHTFCDWYIEISKIELAAPNSAYKNIVQNVLLAVLRSALILMHPIMPFITEEIYQSISFKGKKQSIMIETWPEYDQDFEFDGAQLEEMDDLQKYIYTIRNLRGEYEISPAEKTGVYIGQVKKDNIHRKYEAIIKQLAKTEKILDAYDPASFITANVTSAKGANIAVVGINRNVLKNVGAIIKNKEKRIVELEKAIAGIKNKLDNPKFIENAAKKLVEEETIKMNTYTEEIGKIKNQIQGLGQ